MYQKDSMLRSLEEHQAILIALTNKDKDITAQLMRTHTQKNLDRLLTILDESENME